MTVHILVADGAVFSRRALKDRLEQEAGFSVVALAQNTKDALDKLVFKPDVAILDSELPDGDFVAVLREIRKREPALPIIVYAATARRSSELLAATATLGTIEFVIRPGDARRQADAERELVSRVRLFATKVRASLIPRRSTRPTAKKQPRPEIIVIASSTGGPAALAQVLPLLPRRLAVPVVIVQHMPTSLFTESLTTSLTLTCELEVHHAAIGDTLHAGGIWIAPGGRHLVLATSSAGVTVNLTSDPLVHGVRPAADLLFLSAAQIYGSGVLAVVLTGMGRDGLNGASAVAKAGGVVIAQDQASSVVWGMPGTVVEAGLATSVLPLNRIAGDLTARAGTGGNTAAARS